MTPNPTFSITTLYSAQPGKNFGEIDCLMGIILNYAERLMTGLVGVVSVSHTAQVYMKGKKAVAVVTTLATVEISIGGTKVVRQGSVLISKGFTSITTGQELNELVVYAVRTILSTAFKQSEPEVETTAPAAAAA